MPGRLTCGAVLLESQVGGLGFCQHGLWGPGGEARPPTPPAGDGGTWIRRLWAARGRRLTCGHQSKAHARVRESPCVPFATAAASWLTTSRGDLPHQHGSAGRSPLAPGTGSEVGTPTTPAATAGPAARPGSAPVGCSCCTAPSCTFEASPTRRPEPPNTPCARHRGTQNAQGVNSAANMRYPSPAVPANTGGQAAPPPWPVPPRSSDFRIQVTALPCQVSPPPRLGPCSLASGRPLTQAAAAHASLRTMQRAASRQSSRGRSSANSKHRAVHGGGVRPRTPRSEGLGRARGEGRVVGGGWPRSQGSQGHQGAHLPRTIAPTHAPRPLPPPPTRRQADGSHPLTSIPPLGRGASTP